MPDDQKGLMIQIGDNPGSGVTPQMNLESFANFTDEQIDLVVAGARRVQAGIARGFETVSGVDELSVEFGINAGGEAGVPFVTKGSIGANFKVSLTWKKRE